jgi:hypothetical protein
VSAYPAFDDRAHCRLPGVDAERFHPSQGTDSHTYANTKKLCTGGGKVPACPFLAECREYGLTYNVSGVWGGIGEKERRRIREARRIVPEPLSMGLIAQVPNTRERERQRWVGDSPCPECGKGLHPKGLRRHLRAIHGKQAS